MRPLIHSGYHWRWIVSAVLALAPSVFCLADESFLAVCPSLLIQGELKPDLTEVETRLVCGDPKTEAWKKIPINQVQYTLGNFLQKRGYHHAQYAREQDRLKVVLGERTRVLEIDSSEVPEVVLLSRKRKILGQAMTPDLLDDLERWVERRLRANGYPCPKVTALANPETGVIRLKVETGPLQDLVSVFEEPITGVQSGIMRRYDAFQLGERYNGDWTGLTETRIIRQGIVQSIHFKTTCGPSSALLHQEVVAGPPRLLRFGVGLDTEGVFLLKASWRNTRLGPKASWFDISALGSVREQTLELTLNWYHLPYPSRRSFRPSVEFQHQNQRPYETLSLSTAFSYATTWDLSSAGGTLAIGPVFDFFRTIRGAGAPDSRFASLEIDSTLMSHYYEIFQTSPRAGYLARLRVGLSEQDVLSTATAQRILFDGHALWNIQNLDPPLFVLGVRGGAYFTLSGERPGPQTRLPPEFLHFLGGSKDIRGFSLRELPLNGQGGLTAFYSDFELRVANYLPLGIEPFLFFDLGAIGSNPVSLDAPLFHSPGLGIRWASPIGVFRTTIARGLPDAGTQQRWQFYLSYGEEF